MMIFIIYESHFGNGKKCIEYLQEILNKKGHLVEISSILEVQPNYLPKADLYIFSAPTHSKGPPAQMKDFLKNLKLEKGIKYAIMTTHIAPETKTLKIMENLLKPKGLVKISDGLKVKVNTMQGPLEKDYKEKLESFAKVIT